MAGHHTVLKIKKKSWSSNTDYHVKTGWTIQTELFTDDKGNQGLRVKTLRSN